MDADLRMTGEEMDGEEEELETDGFGLDLIIRRMIGELPTLGLPSRSGLFLPELLGLARLPRGEERPGGGRPEAPLLLRAGFEPIPMPEREGDEARRGARAVDIEGRFEVRSWLGGLGLNFLGGGWGEGCSVQWVASKLVAASCHCCRLPFVNVSSDLVEAGLLSLLIVRW